MFYNSSQLGFYGGFWQIKHPRRTYRSSNSLSALAVLTEILKARKLRLFPRNSSSVPNNLELLIHHTSSGTHLVISSHAALASRC
jgi:hypothetical protein